MTFRDVFQVFSQLGIFIFQTYLFPLAFDSSNVPYQRNRPYGGTFFYSDEIADNFTSDFAEIGAELAKEISEDDA